jgi:hypothetical protein
LLLIPSNERYLISRNEIGALLLRLQSHDLKDTDVVSGKPLALGIITPLPILMTKQDIRPY